MRRSVLLLVAGASLSRNQSQRTVARWVVVAKAADTFRQPGVFGFWREFDRS